ncbi:MAG: flagellar hook assembly protein FlgD [Rhodospirillales bacterium]|jgi:flagellar basal-body rod modification protein FlgD|nr:flagellar hook assembly protein FlgD [Rhodospirillales bacterium]
MALLSGVSGDSTFIDADSQAGQDSAKLNEDLNAFLNLLVTQLKHQDPLDPMDANEFTSQLVQFASVEQQIYGNSHLESLVGLQETSQVSFMVDYLGTTIESTGDTFMVEDGTAEFSYSLLDTNAYETLITINDADGKAVIALPGETEVGYHGFQWDGIDANGQQVPDGLYSVNVSAVDPFGNFIDVSQTVTGRVTGAGNESGDIVLYTGEVAVPMTAILNVNETPAAQAVQ